MAVATGSQIRPELSAVDYTPFLQASGQAAQMQARGAENIAAGLANLGQQAGAAIKQYYAKKESKQLEDDAVSLISTKIEKNQSLGDFIGVKRDKDGVLDKKALRVAVKTVGVPAILSAAKSLDEEEKLKSFLGQENASAAATAIQGGASFEQLPKDSAAYKPAPMGFQELMQRGLAVGMKPSDIASLGNAMANAREAELRSQPKPKDAPSGYMFMGDGSLQAIPGGPVTEARAIEAKRAEMAAADNARQEAELKLKIDEATAKSTSDAEKKKLAAEALTSSAQDARLSAETTLNEIEKARGLVDRAFAQGRGSGIGAFFSGSSANDLENSYDVIRANEALSRIIALKKASPTGSTGFGALNLKELETLQSRFAKLSIKNSDDAAKQSLNDLERVILKAFPDLTPKPKEKGKGSNNRSSAPMSPTQFKAGSRFEVMSTSP